MGISPGQDRRGAAGVRAPGRRYHADARAGSRERLERRRPADRAQRVGQAAPQEPRAPDRGAGADARRPRPLLVLPGYPTPHEAQLGGARCRRSGSPTTCGCWAGFRRGARGPLRRRGRFVFPSLTRASACPCWRRWPAACPVACSDRGALAEVERRRGTALRPRVERRRSRPRSERLLTTAPQRIGCGAGLRAARSAGRRPRRHARDLRASAAPRGRQTCGRRRSARARSASECSSESRSTLPANHGLGLRSAGPPSWTRTIASASQPRSAEGARSRCGRRSRAPPRRCQDRRRPRSGCR